MNLPSSSFRGRTCGLLPPGHKNKQTLYGKKNKHFIHLIASIKHRIPPINNKLVLLVFEKKQILTITFVRHWRPTRVVNISHLNWWTGRVCTGAFFCIGIHFNDQQLLLLISWKPPLRVNRSSVNSKDFSQLQKVWHFYLRHMESL